LLVEPIDGEVEDGVEGDPEQIRNHHDPGEVIHPAEHDEHDTEHAPQRR